MKANEFDAIVIGTGIAGTSTAIHLAHAKKRVLLIGKRGMPGEASTAATGILDPVLESKPGSPLLRLALKAFVEYPAFIKTLEKRTSGKVGYHKTGLLYLAMNLKELGHLKKSYAWQRKTAIPVRFLSPEEILTKEPMVDPKVLGGLYFPTSGRVKPKQLMLNLKRYAKLSGVRIFTSFSNSDLILSGGVVKGIRNGKRIFKSPVVVNAAGAWSGVPGMLKKKAAVVPARGQLLIGKSKKISVTHILHTPSGDYLVPWNKNEFLLGSTVEFAGFKPRTSKRALSQISKRIQRLVPEVRHLKQVKDWAGLRPYSKTQNPIAGPTSIPGLFLNTGFYKSGILIGYETSRQLARWITTGKAPELLKSFQPKP